MSVSSSTGSGSSSSDLKVPQGLRAMGIMERKMEKNVETYMGTEIHKGVYKGI